LHVNRQLYIYMSPILWMYIVFDYVSCRTLRRRLSDRGSRVRWTKDESRKKLVFGGLRVRGRRARCVRELSARWRTGIRDEPRLRASFVLLFRTCYRTKGSNPSTLTGCAGSVVTMGLWWTGHGWGGEAKDEGFEVKKPCRTKY